MLAKAALFVVIAALCAAGLLLESPRLSTGILVVLLAWASVRFYYFLFYVLHTYVDPSLKYSGLTALVLAALRRRRETH